MHIEIPNQLRPAALAHLSPRTDATIAGVEAGRAAAFAAAGSVAALAEGNMTAARRVLAGVQPRLDAARGQAVAELARLEADIAGSATAAAIRWELADAARAITRGLSPGSDRVAFIRASIRGDGRVAAAVIGTTGPESGLTPAEREELAREYRAARFPADVARIEAISEAVATFSSGWAQFVEAFEAIAAE